MDGKVFVIAALAGIVWYGGAAIGHGVKVGAKKTGCGVEKVFTLGHKHCKAKTGSTKTGSTKNGTEK